MTGWIRLSREILSDPGWTCEAFSRGQAFIDLIMLANFERGYLYVRGNKIVIERGQVGWSQKRLAERWKWSRSKVRKFLNDLEEEQQIKQQKNPVTTVITITKYEQYQGKEHQTSPQKDSGKTANRTTEKPQTDTNKEEELRNKEEKKNDISTRVSVDVLDDPPTLEDVVKFGELNFIPKTVCKNYYNQRQSVGWCKQMGEKMIPIQNWTADLLYVHAKGWFAQAEDKSPSSNYQPSGSQTEKLYNEQQVAQICEDEGITGEARRIIFVHQGDGKYRRTIQKRVSNV